MLASADKIIQLFDLNLVGYSANSLVFSACLWSSRLGIVSNSIHSRTTAMSVSLLGSTKAMSAIYSKLSHSLSFLFI